MVAFICLLEPNASTSIIFITKYFKYMFYIYIIDMFTNKYVCLREIEWGKKQNICAQNTM